MIFIYIFLTVLNGRSSDFKRFKNDLNDIRRAIGIKDLSQVCLIPIRLPFLAALFKVDLSKTFIC